MGKYAKLKGALPTFKPEESYQVKVNQVKIESKLSELSSAELGQMFIDTQNMIDELEIKLKALALVKEAVSQELIEALEEDGVASFRLAGGALIYQQDEPYTSVKDRDVYLKWIRENGYDGLLNVPYQSTNALAKTELLEGRPNPPGTEVFMKTSIRYRRN